MPKRLWAEGKWDILPLWDEVRSYLNLREVFQTRLVSKKFHDISRVPLVFNFEHDMPPEEANLENVQVINYCGCPNKYREGDQVYIHYTKHLQQLVRKCGRKLKHLHVRVVGEPDFTTPFLPKLESFYIGNDIGTHVTYEILDNSPNISKLWALNLPILDFAKLLDLKEYVTSKETRFLNIEYCKLDHLRTVYVKNKTPIELLLNCRLVTLLLRGDIDQNLIYLLRLLRTEGACKLEQINFRLQSFEYDFEIDCRSDSIVLGYKSRKGVPCGVSAEQISLARSRADKNYEKNIRTLLNIFPVEYQLDPSLPEQYKSMIRKAFSETCCGEEDLDSDIFEECEFESSKTTNNEQNLDLVQVYSNKMPWFVFKNK